MRDTIWPALVWLGQLALSYWPTTVLLGVVIWQRGIIRTLRGNTDAWYHLWLETEEKLKALKHRATKARARAKG